MLDFSSQFWERVRAWAAEDPILVVGGSLAAFVSLLRVRRRPVVALMGALTLSLWVFLGRGGQVLEFYLVPLLPLLSITLVAVLAAVYNDLHSALGPRRLSKQAVGRFTVSYTGLLVVAVVALYSSADPGLARSPLLPWQAAPAYGQGEAVAWVRHNLPASSRIVIDMYMWLDLHQAQPGRRAYAHAEYYWKAEEDPEIRDRLFENDWRTIDYVITTPQLLYDEQHNVWPMLRNALAHSVVVARFDTGWAVEVRKVLPG